MSLTLIDRGLHRNYCPQLFSFVLMHRTTHSSLRLGRNSRRKTENVDVRREDWMSDGKRSRSEAFKTAALSGMAVIRPLTRTVTPIGATPCHGETLAFFKCCVSR